MTTPMLRDLIGQSLLLNITGSSTTPELLDLIAQIRPCGIVLFRSNIGDPAELYTLNQTLQAHAASLGMPPLLIAIDQEGGIVSRLPAPWTTPPSQMAQAATGDPAAAFICAQLTSQQLRAYGINTNFAPVLDVNSNLANPVIGTRSFGADPGLVVRWALEALRGYAEAGVIAVGKHFPGHGDTSLDSHLGLPVVQHDQARLRAIELDPFKATIAAGIPALMTAHIVFSAFDSQPATLSAYLLTTLLREELNFTGVIFSDSLQMQAIADIYGLAEASVLAKAAGVDVLLAHGPPADQLAAATALSAALGSGRLQAASFEATAGRLDRLRAAYNLTHTLPTRVAPDPSIPGRALEIARRSVTVMQQTAVVPLKPTVSLGVIECVVPRFSQVEEAESRSATLRAQIRAAFPNSAILLAGPDWSPELLATAAVFGREHELVLLITRDAAFLPEQVQLANRLASAGRPFIHAAVRNPYDVSVIQGASATLLTYGDAEVSLQALVDVLVGKLVPQSGPPIPLLNDPASGPAPSIVT